MARALILLTAIAFCAPAMAQNMQPGEWRLTSTIHFSDTPKPEITTENECLTKEDIEDVNRWLRDFPDCNVKPGKKTADSYSWQFSCPKSRARGSGSMRWTSTTVELDMDLATSADSPAGKMEMRAKMSGKRLGPCK